MDGKRKACVCACVCVSVSESEKETTVEAANCDQFGPD